MLTALAVLTHVVLFGTMAAAFVRKSRQYPTHTRRSAPVSVTLRKSRTFVSLRKSGSAARPTSSRSVSLVKA